jgi:Ca-activated chloride channel family protein
MRLADPAMLLLLLALVPMALAYRKRPSAVRFPSLKVLGAVRPSRLSALRHVPFALRCLAVAAVAIALARPQVNNGKSERTTEGLDIMLVLDTSGSMMALDYAMNGEHITRIDAVKRTTADFIRERPDDRIGIVVFGSEAFTQAPLTLDHDVLARFLDRIEVGVAGDATAIGDGVVTAVNRLKNIPAKAKVAILLTDGANNAGRADPLAAAQAAKAMGVKVYTIAFGSDAKQVPIVVDGQLRYASFELDEETCKKIAAATGGTYFRAANTETLQKVYETIDQLEKTKVKVDNYDNYEERYHPFASLAAILLAGELAMRLTRFRRIP